ncbi:MAG TPA: hypothetical protein VLH19_05675 [Patescibacteria group bacterium]|nr:hypothetical protein [Patescibacteria group bacterium]
MAITKDPVVTQSFLNKKFKEFLENMDDYFQREHEYNKKQFVAILGRLQAIEENNTVATHQTAENSDTIENHEKRIGAIEVKLQLV